jgi:DNA-directed RNA polymerase specialized sigma subunit
MIDNLQRILNDYKPQYDIFKEDDEYMTRLKESVMKLNDADRIIFIMYCECGSLRKVGKMLGISHTSAYKCIKKIKEQILNDIGYITN